MKRFKGIIFDFNGTIFLDSPFHEKAWLEYAKTKLGIDVTVSDYYKYFHGRTNPMIYKHIYNKTIPKEIAALFGQGKEQRYRELCMDNKDNLTLAKGSLELFDFLNKNCIPHAIATSSEINNVNFFKKLFNLEGWFGKNIIYDDGHIRGKPEPDLYLKAGEKLGLDMNEVIIVEDANSGVIAARRSGAGMVIGISPYGKEKFVGKEYTDLVIEDFTELDFSIFIK